MIKHIFLSLKKRRRKLWPQTFVKCWQQPVNVLQRYPSITLLVRFRNKIIYRPSLNQKLDDCLASCPGCNRIILFSQELLSWEIYRSSGDIKSPGFCQLCNNNNNHTPLNQNDSLTSTYPLFLYCQIVFLPQCPVFWYLKGDNPRLFDHISPRWSVLVDKVGGEGLRLVPVKTPLATDCYLLRGITLAAGFISLCANRCACRYASVRMEKKES